MKISLHIVFYLNARAYGMSQVLTTVVNRLNNHPHSCLTPEEANQQETRDDKRLNFLADLDLWEKVLIRDALNRLVHCIHIQRRCKGACE